MASADSGNLRYVRPALSFPAMVDYLCAAAVMPPHAHTPRFVLHCLTINRRTASTATAALQGFHLNRETYNLGLQLIAQTVALG